MKLRKLAIFQSALMIVQPKSKASDAPKQLRSVSVKA
nr:MAG TPA: hypothetical protein [Caudoviricetes sp.]